MRMALIVSERAAHQYNTALAIQDGMRVHGDEGVIFFRPENFNNVRLSEHFDAISTWGWRRAQPFHQTYPVLVMERAYIADRFEWVSLGWNGLNGRAQWPNRENSIRWEKHFSQYESPWQPNKEPQLAVVMGQVPTDSAVRGIDFLGWAGNIISNLQTKKYPVKFRPHPNAPYAIPGVAKKLTIFGDLSDSLFQASVAVTFNSNTGVDAVLAGVPTVAENIGSMAYEIAFHSVEEFLESRGRLPDRTKWRNRLAYRQWLPDEIRSGEAWSYVKEALHAQR